VLSVHGLLPFHDLTLATASSTPESEPGVGGRSVKRHTRHRYHRRPGVGTERTS